MSKHGHSFMQGRAGAFLESIAMERNLHSERAIMTCGVGPGIEYSNVFERAVHNLAPFNDVHSTPIFDTIAVGEPGAFGSDSIGGSGWARVYLRVKGVAHRIPPIDYEVTEGSANEKRSGSLMFIAGSNVYSEIRTTHRVLLIHPGSPRETPMLTQGRVAMNVFEDEVGFNSSTVAIDRVVAFSALLPVNYAPQLPGFSWTGSVFPSGGNRYLYVGGTQPDGDSAFTTFAALGTSIAPREICTNALNSLNLLTGLPLFSDPTNVIQLQIQRLGFRPASGPARETFLDLAALT